MERRDHVDDVVEQRRSDVGKQRIVAARLGAAAATDRSFVLDRVCFPPLFLINDAAQATAWACVANVMSHEGAARVISAVCCQCHLLTHLTHISLAVRYVCTLIVVVARLARRSVRKFKDAVVCMFKSDCLSQRSYARSVGARERAVWKSRGRRCHRAHGGSANKWRCHVDGASGLVARAVTADSDRRRNTTAASVCQSQTLRAAHRTRESALCDSVIVAPKQLRRSSKR